MNKNDSVTPPQSPDSLERGIRGRVTGVTRIGPRVLGVAALAAFIVVGLILAGANKAPSHQTVATIADAAPMPQDTAHFGADEPLVDTNAPARRTETVHAGGNVPDGLVLPSSAPPVLPSSVPRPSAASPEQIVPNIPGATAETTAAPLPAPDAAAQARAQREADAMRARADRQAQLHAMQIAAYEAPVLVNDEGNRAAAPPAGAAQIAQAPPPSAPMPVASQNPNAFLIGPFGHTGAQPLAAGGTANASDYLDAQRYAPRGKFEVTAGSVIPAELITGIDSEQPGLITAQVREDVFDSRTGRYVLIPRGARLIGVYKSDVQTGQTRVLVAWQRLIFPDTSSIDLHDQAGADTEGYAGLGGKVDTHFGQVLQAAILSSIISAGLQLSQPQQTATVGTVVNPSAGQTIAGSIGQQVAQVGSAAVQKEMNIPPTIHVPRGYPFVVIVDRDMVLPAPYAPAP